MSNLKIIKVLHVVRVMNRGGVETWLMHVLRNIDKTRFKMDFMVSATEPGAYDDEIRSLGSKIIPCMHPHNPLRFAYNFYKAIKQNGPYDVIHSHVHHYSGFVLFLANLYKIPVRIAHSHNDTSSKELNPGFFRSFYLGLMKLLIKRYATIGFGASDKAAVDLFGVKWHSDPRWHTLFCGIDLKPFNRSIDPLAIRLKLGIPVNAFVIGHVGRFDEQKNHGLLIQIAAEVIRKNPGTYLLLIGEGTLQPLIKKKVEILGISKNVIFAGVQNDVPALMSGAMDVFLFPSLYEGLPLVLIEAQAAGLRCIISDAIAFEADIIKQNIKRISIHKTPKEWAEEMLTNSKPVVSRKECLSIVSNSQFNIHSSIQKIERIYQERQYE